MQEKHIPYGKLNYFSQIIKDYLKQKEAVKPFYDRFPGIDQFEQQIKDKQHAWRDARSKRETLVNVLHKQYEFLEDKKYTKNNIDALAQVTTFTITTGHQLNLFTGPLYFLYKIISTINLCKQLKEHYPAYSFVPIYWMATEDHDFEEIQYFNYNDRKIVLNKESGGAVGRLSVDGTDQVYQAIEKLLPNSEHGIALKELFKKSYLEHDNLANATRYLAHQLFKDEGLVIVDADHANLKKIAIPTFKEELVQQSSYNAVRKTLENWPTDYGIQVNPREINLFYLTATDRKRILVENDTFYIDGTSTSFSKAQILTELESYPERFSPNVIMRPLYQELILPNLCYIGGGGELAYWFELKNYFESQKVVFPILLMRNSVLLITSKQAQKVKKLSCDLIDLFESKDQLATTITNNVTAIPIDFTDARQQLHKQFKDLYHIATRTDPSFKKAVAAQEKKQLNGLDTLEKRLLKAQKRKYKDHIDRAQDLQTQLFPNNSLQERQHNFSQYYQDYGPQLIEILKDSLDPLNHTFTVITLP